MRLLLDTCTFLWMIWDDPALGERQRAWIADPANEVFLSAVSIWEACQKHALGRLDVTADEGAWQHFTGERDRHLCVGLPFTEGDSRHVARLPLLHRDPFDRMLICQAIEHGLTLVTPDEQIRRYPIKTLW